MRKAYIVAAKRSAIGSFMGGLTNIKLVDLGATVLKETIKQSGIDPKDIDEVLVGNVIAAGLGQNIGRQVSIAAGIPVEVCAQSINMLCGSGLKAVMEAAIRIQAGFGDVYVAGGVESMTKHHYASELGYKYEAPRCTPPACKDSHTAPSKADMPKTWLFESILVTLFCCLPLGIGGIIYASRVQALWSGMRYAEALDASNRAKQWTKWGLLLAVIDWLIYVLVALLVPAARDTVWFFNENI